MKAIMITLAAIFSLTMNVLFAGNFEPAVNHEMNISYNMLAPVTPAEATFEETVYVEFISLVPVAPLTAEFSDAPETGLNLFYLAPVTPAEADFSDEEVKSTTISLIPVTPAVADFSEDL